jgi:hypothetical protein
MRMDIFFQRYIYFENTERKACGQICFNRMVSLHINVSVGVRVLLKKLMLHFITADAGMLEKFQLFTGSTK